MKVSKRRFDLRIEQLKIKSEHVDRITKVAESREFDLKYILRDEGVNDIKYYFNDLGKHIDLTSVETENQINAMTRLMKIIDKSIPKIDQRNQDMKLRIKSRRKNIFNRVKDQLSVPDKPDVVLLSKRRSAMFNRNENLLDPTKLSNQSMLSIQPLDQNEVGFYNIKNIFYR